LLLRRISRQSLKALEGFSDLLGEAKANPLPAYLPWTGEVFPVALMGAVGAFPENSPEISQVVALSSKVSLKSLSRS